MDRRCFGVVNRVAGITQRSCPDPAQRVKNAAPHPEHELHGSLFPLPRRIAEYGRTLRDIAGDHRASADHGIVTDA
jgi:hypothetical protein